MGSPPTWGKREDTASWWPSVGQDRTGQHRDLGRPASRAPRSPRSPACGDPLEAPGLMKMGLTWRASKAWTPYPSAVGLGDSSGWQGSADSQVGIVMPWPAGQGRGERGELQTADPQGQEPQADRSRTLGRGKPSLPGQAGQECGRARA